MRRLTLVLAIGTFLTVLFLGAFMLTDPAKSVQAERLKVPELGGSGPLDGLTFLSDLGQAGKPADVEDKLVFADGMFVSTECERRCNYPASPYFVRKRDEVLEFVSETRCPYKDATIVWRGTIENGTIKGESTWTVKRWYWTVDKKFWFEGKLSEQTVSVVGG